MAVYPCDMNGHRYAAAQQSLYVTICKNGDTFTHKLRLCPMHMDIELGLIRGLMKPLEDMLEAGMVCDSCGARTEAIIFAKVFLPKQEPLQYVSDRCGGCQIELTNRLQIGNGRAL